ncbi:ArsA-related P-loop ATPase [Ferrimicrobium sp.]|uniref:ArsA family ATPase n=1 Tax=Ferrimicrobium sp. TaxID=2926050 RepID=UPI002627C709|nr:ArsA-related P-loop ATPase [Ferrimicrobium sp.]
MQTAKARIILSELIGDPRLVLVTGKGGVGKSSVARLIALVAQTAGLKPLLVLFDEFGGESDGIEQVILLPDAVMLEYLETHGFGPLAQRLLKSGVIDAVSTAIPGIRDLLVLAKIKQLVNSGIYDLVLVDAPASGHLLSLLSSPDGLGAIATDGPIASQSADVIALLRDQELTGVVLVTLPEETPVQETSEVYTNLTTLLATHVLSCVVNRMPAMVHRLDDLMPGSAEDRANQYLTSRSDFAQAQVQVVRGLLPVPVFEFPFVEDATQPTKAAKYLFDQADRWEIQ